MSPRGSSSSGKDEKKKNKEHTSMMCRKVSRVRDGSWFPGINNRSPSNELVSYDEKVGNGGWTYRSKKNIVLVIIGLIFECRFLFQLVQVFSKNSRQICIYCCNYNGSRLHSKKEHWRIDEFEIPALFRYKKIHKVPRFLIFDFLVRFGKIQIFRKILLKKMTRPFAWFRQIFQSANSSYTDK